MASEERNAADKIEVENVFESLSAVEQQAEMSTDTFQRSRYKQVSLNKKKWV